MFRRTTCPLRVTIRGSLLEPRRFHLLFSDWDVGLVARALSEDELASLQKQISLWKSRIPFLSEFELYFENELASIPSVASNELLQILKWCRKILDLQLRLLEEESPFSQLKHRRSLQIAQSRLCRLVGSSHLDPFAAVEVGLDTFVQRAVRNPIICTPGMVENILEPARWHDVLNVELKVSPATSPGCNSASFEVSPHTYLHLFLVLLGGYKLEATILQDPEIRRFLKENLDLKRCLLSVEITKIRAFCRTVSSPAPWLLEKLVNLESAIAVELPTLVRENAVGPVVDRLLLKGMSFLEVGGVWGGAHDIFSAATTKELSQVAQLDLAPESVQAWRNLRARVQLRGGREFSMISQDLLDYTGPAFDVVYCSHVLIHNSDLQPFFAKLREVCKSTLVLRTLFAYDELPGRKEDIYFLRDLSPRERQKLERQLNITEIRSRIVEPDQTALPRDHSQIWNIPSERGLFRLLEQNGFTVSDKLLELENRVLCLICTRVATEH